MTLISVRCRTSLDPGPSLSPIEARPRDTLMSLCHESDPSVFRSSCPFRSTAPNACVPCHRHCSLSVLQEWLCQLLQVFSQLFLHDTDKPFPSISSNFFQWTKTPEIVFICARKQKQPFYEPGYSSSTQLTSFTFCWLGLGKGVDRRQRCGQCHTFVSQKRSQPKSISNVVSSSPEKT